MLKKPGANKITRFESSQNRFSRVKAGNSECTDPDIKIIPLSHLAASYFFKILIIFLLANM